MVARTVCAEVHRHVHQKPTLETQRRGKQEASPAQGGDTSMKHRTTAGALPARRVHRKVKGARTGAVICPHSGVSFTKDGEAIPDRPGRSHCFLPPCPANCSPSPPPSAPACCSTISALHGRLPARQVSVSRARMWGVFHGSPPTAHSNKAQESLRESAKNSAAVPATACCLPRGPGRRHLSSSAQKLHHPFYRSGN